MEIDTPSCGKGRYINQMTDYGFKRIFGDKVIMKAFLTDLLQPESPIVGFTFMDKEEEYNMANAYSQSFYLSSFPLITTTISPFISFCSK